METGIKGIMAKSCLIPALTLVLVINPVKTNRLMDYNTTEQNEFSREQPLNVLSNSTISFSNNENNNNNVQEKGALDGIVQFEKLLAEEKAKLLSPSLNLTYDETYRRSFNRFPGNLQTSENCLSHIEYVIDSVKKRFHWALEMIDSTGKPSPGILQGNYLFPGDFDQCIDVDTGVDFDGQYCTISIVITEILNTTLAAQLQFSLGVCFPSSCESKDVENYINVYFQSQPSLSALAVQTKCQERHLSLTTKAKFVICICSIFVTLLVIGTFYDAIYKRWWLEHGNASYNQNSQLTNGTAKMLSEHDPIIDPELHKPKMYSNHETAPKEYPSQLYDICDKLLMSFSVYTNTAKLFTVNRSQDSIDCLHGMRFISMTWVILLHVVTLIDGSIENISPFLDEAYTDWTFMPIIRSVNAVDTFFAMSGLLLTYGVLKKISKENVTIKFFGDFYLHRYLRLTPPYILILMTYVPLFKYLSDGPFWLQDGAEIDECEDTWWTNLLYLNNFIRTEKMCMIWSWYLANDFQFHLVSPLMFIPMLFYDLKGLIAPLAFLLGSAICAGVISNAKDFPVFLGLNLHGDFRPYTPDFIKYFYIKPYTRIGPFVIGMVAGFFLLKSGCKAHISKLVVILGWMAATAMALAVIYGLYDQVKMGDGPSTDVCALYNALNSIAWGISVCWVIFACANGYGGFVNTLLSWKPFVPLSRLSYCAYLVHPIVIKYYFYSQRKPIYMNYLNISFAFVAVVPISYAVAYIAYMAYEVPMVGLEKLVRGQRKRH